MSDIAIKFENISKQYRLGTVSTGTISHDINRWWHLVRGKEDPYLKIGDVNDRSSKASSEYVWALKDITFDVKQGDVVGIIGKNGAGKSTLLKILSRVTSPTTGFIKAKGRIASLLEVGTGFHPELTGRENIYMNGAIMGMTKKEITRKLDEIVDFAGIEKYIDTPTKRYSSGMTVRLGFAIAAHLEPEILVVDEVLAVGDAEFQKKAIGKMQDVSRGEGRTVLFVSHNMTAVKTLCKNGVILKNGTIDFVGNISTCIERYIAEQDHRSSLNFDLLNRSGDGSLKFEKVTFLNEKLEEVKIIQIGQPMYIKVDFKATDFFYDQPQSTIDIGINNSFGARVTWIGTKMYEEKIKKGTESVTFFLKHIFLPEGSYNLNLYAGTSMGISDYLLNVSKFDVLNTDFYGTGRIMPSSNTIGYYVSDFTVKI